MGDNGAVLENGIKIDTEDEMEEGEAPVTEKEATADMATEKDTEELAGDAGSLTGRVIDLMVELSEYGYLSIAEIMLIYSNRSHAYEVLKQLMGRGLVSDFKTGLVPKKAYCLTSEGYRMLEHMGRLRITKRFNPDQYKDFIFPHRMASAKVGLIMKTHPFVKSFDPEGVLWPRKKKEDEKVCDGEFLYQPPLEETPVKVGLEVELTLKNRDRLAESFRQLAGKNLDQVWWICADDPIKWALAKTARLQTADRPKHLFALMDDFLKDRHALRLHNSSGEIFTIDPPKADLPTADGRKTDGETRTKTASGTGAGAGNIESATGAIVVSQPGNPGASGAVALWSGSPAQTNSDPSEPELSLLGRFIEDSFERNYSGTRLKTSRKLLIVAALGGLCRLFPGPFVSFHQQWGWLYAASGWTEGWIKRPLAHRDFRLGPLEIQLSALERIEKWHRLRFVLAIESSAHCVMRRVDIFNSAGSILAGEDMDEELTTAFPFAWTLIFYKPAQVDQMTLVARMSGPADACRTLVIPVEFQ